MVSKYWREMMIVILICAAGSMIAKLHYAHLQKCLDDQNLSALSDSISITQNRAGEIEYQKEILVASEKTLKNLNAGLAAELKKEKDKVLFLSRSKLTISTPEQRADSATMTMDSTDSTRHYRFSWNIELSGSGWNKRLEGMTAVTMAGMKTGFSSLHLGFDSTVILKDELKTSLKTGLSWNSDKRLQVFNHAAYPGLSWGDIKGAFIDEKMFLKTDNRSWFKRNRYATIVTAAAIGEAIVIYYSVRR